MDTSQPINKELAWGPVDPFDEHDLYFWVKIEHLARYLFAADYLQGKAPTSIADIACGMGYGLAELERVAEHIIGVDASPEVLKLAEKHVNSQKVQLLHCNIEAADQQLARLLGSSSLQSIVCFETVEHLAHPGIALAQFAQVLQPQGLLICSVPNLLFEGRDFAGLPKNQYHKQLFSYHVFSQLLSEHGFDILYRLGQSWTNTLFKLERRLIEQEVFQKGISDQPCMRTPEMIRLCARLFAYPTVEDVEGSYSLIVIARKRL